MKHVALLIGAVGLASCLARPVAAFCFPDPNICPNNCDDGDPCTRDLCYAGSPICGCFHEAPTDPDADGVCSLLDNCPTVPNPDQADSDGNGIGDVCEDPDGDGVPSSLDLCPNSDLRSTVIVGQCDSGAPNYHHDDGCTTADKVAACHDSTEDRASYLDCVRSVTFDLWRAGELTARERGQILRCAAGPATAVDAPGGAVVEAPAGFKGDAIP